MESVGWYVFATLLVLTSAALVASHVVGWRKRSNQPLEPLERDFRWRQFRRRVQASLMVGLLGVALFVGAAISPERSPLLFVLFWLGFVLVVFWLALLGVADAIATRVYVGRMQRESIGRLGQLRRELAEHQAAAARAREGSGSIDRRKEEH